MTRLENFYKEQVVAKLTEQFGYQNVMQVPRITKITLNMGVGEAAGNKKVLENAVADMAKISRPRRAFPFDAVLSATAGRSAARSPCAARRCSSS